MHQATSSLVLPDIADTTTATSCPASTSRLTWRATLRIRSRSATEVPPNFITKRAIENQNPGNRRGLRIRTEDRFHGPETRRRVYIPARFEGRNRSESRDMPLKYRRIRFDHRRRRGRAFRAHGQDLVGRARPDGAAAQVQSGAAAYIRDQAAAHFNRDPKQAGCLTGLRILDIGCGGGILSEPLARLGASMVGADPARAISRSRAAHAEQEGLCDRLSRRHRRRPGRCRRALRHRAGHGSGRACRRRRSCSCAAAARW